MIFNQQTTLENSFLLIFHQEFSTLWNNDVIMTSHGILKAISCFPLDMVVYFQIKPTLQEYLSFRMSAFIFGVCFSTFIYFSFVFNKKFQHVQMLLQVSLSRSNYSK